MVISKSLKKYYFCLKTLVIVFFLNIYSFDWVQIYSHVPMIYYVCCYISTFNNFNTNLIYHYKTWKLKYGLHLRWLLLMWMHMCVKLRCALLPWIPKAIELCARILSSKHSPCQTRHLLFQTNFFSQTPHFFHFLSIWKIFMVVGAQSGGPQYLFERIRSNQTMSNINMFILYYI